MDSLITTLAGIAILYTILVVSIRLFMKDTAGPLLRFLNMTVSVATFPGIILRESTRKLICDMVGVHVIEAKYFQLGIPAGYVIHDRVSRYRDAYLLAIGPFAVNSAFAMVMFMVSSLIGSSSLEILFLWLGASFAVCALPGDADAQSLWRWSKRLSEDNPLAFLATPPIIIVGCLARIRKGLRVNIIYMVALYSVTFCLVAAIMFAGSFALPGVYTVKIAAADPASAAQGFSQSSYSAIPTYPPSSGTSGYAIGVTSRPNPYTSDIAGKEAPAKAWLSIANTTMNARNANAVLVSIHGYSSEMGTSLPINGLCHRWWYRYASPADNKVYDVFVHDGVLERVSETTGTLNTAVDSKISAFDLDSTDIIGPAFTAYRGLTDKEPASAAYVLNLDYQGHIKWTVYFYDTTSRVIANLNVDPVTGAVNNTWLNPGA